MSKQAIGLFDSGVGGLSIWKAVQQLLPNENTIYLADNKNMPYGDRTKDEIIALSEKNTEFLLENNVKLIIVACNTASTNAIPHLRRKYKIPFIRIQPAIKPAGLQTKTGKIGLLATKGTLKSNMLEELKQIIPVKDVEIIGQVGKGLVEIIEQDKSSSDESFDLLTQYLRPMMEENIDQLVLGCTHYPFLIPQIRKIVGNGVNIVEPSFAIARQTKRVLQESDLLNQQSKFGVHLFYANKDIRILSGILKDYANVHVELKNF